MATGLTMKKNWPPLDLKYAFFRDATVPQLFAEAAASFPEKIALRSAEGKVTYAQLLSYSVALAASLRDHGVTPGSFVALAMPRSCAAVGAILAILFAGAAYVPLDVEGSPESLLRQQLFDSGASLVLVDGSMCCKAAAWNGCQTFNAPSIFSSLSLTSEEVQLPGVSAEDPIYVMFTSGSTGNPKGVIVPHRAVARLVSGQQYLNFSPNETFLLHSPLGFDASTLELWGSLLHGGCLVIAPARTIAVAEYRDILEKNEVTALWMTSAMFHLAADYAPETFHSLQQLIVGGDVILPQAVKKVQSASPRLNIVNGYGPTENCTFTACYRIPKSLEVNASLPIGHAIEHTSIYILDERQQPVSDGETGELVAAGSGVALGYVNRPKETSAKFVPDPFSSDRSARMYRTGDRVRRDPSGLIHFLGRFDNEIKISGRRVDLTELEALVSKIDGVRACAACVLASASGQKELALAIEMPCAAADSEQSLRQQLSTMMPAALLPSAIRITERLPMNANGKLDRSAIQREFQNRFVAAKPAPNASDRESTLDTVLRLWQELLGKEAISPDGNFFDAGGSSLLLIQLHALLNQRYQGRLSLLDLFQATTARKMSSLLDTRISEHQQVPAKAI